MTTFDDHANWAWGVVNAAPSPATSGTSLTVTGASRFTGATPFKAVICPEGVRPESSNAEIVTVTNIAGSTFTITRAQESTSARTVVSGDRIYQAVTAGDILAIQAVASSLVNRISASDTTYAGTVRITTAGEGITISTDASGVVVSGAQSAVRRIIASDATFSSGTLTISGAGEGITVTTAANKINISGAQTGVKSLIASDATFSSGSVTISGSGAATVSSAASKILVSVPAGASHSGDLIDVVIGGNTSGVTASVTDHLSLVGGNQMTLSQNAGAITFSGRTPMQVIASDATFQTGTVTVSGVGEGITVNTAAGKIQVSGAQTGVKSLIISASDGAIQSHTSGSVEIAPVAPLGFATPFGSDLPLLTGGGKISAIEMPFPGAQMLLGGLSIDPGQSSALFQRFNVPGGMSMDSLGMVLSNVSSVTTGTGAFTILAVLASQMTGASSQRLGQIMSSSFTSSFTSGTNASSNWGGVTAARRYNMPFNTTFTPGDYWIGIQTRRPNTTWSGCFLGMPGVAGVSPAGRLPSNSSSVLPFGVGAWNGGGAVTSVTSWAGTDMIGNTSQGGYPWLVIFDGGYPW